MATLRDRILKCSRDDDPSAPPRKPEKVSPWVAKALRRELPAKAMA